MNKSSKKPLTKAALQKKITVVDVFCGVGGLTRGIKDAGLKVVAGIDFDNSCRFAFEQNNRAKFLHRDVTTIKPNEIKKLYPKDSIKVLVGCAPCQPFSKVPGEREDKEGKWRLLYSFAELIEQVKPSVVSMENVPQLRSYKNGIVLKKFTKRLEALGYTVSIYKVNAAYYEVPQRRYRLILFASKFGKVSLIPPICDNDTMLTVADAIQHLPELLDGEPHPDDSLHRARKLTPINLKRIAATSEGGNWTEWPDELLRGLNCRKSKKGKKFTSAYSRMAWNKPAPTLTTHCIGLSNGCYGHPVQNRAISLREAALLQSFPSKYRFIKKNDEMNMGVIARHIGNAVPPKLGEAIGKSILQHLIGIKNQ